MFGRGKRIENLLGSVLAELHHIKRRIQTMALSLDQLISDINTATSAVAARLDKLTAEITSAGQAPTQAQLDELAAISAHLTAMGQDPANPVPAPSPAPSTP